MKETHKHDVSKLGHGRLKKSTRENSLGAPPKRALAGAAHAITAMRSRVGRASDPASHGAHSQAERSAATRQAFSRGTSASSASGSARRESSNMARRTLAAIEVQTVVRAAQARRDYQRKRTMAIRLQAVVRGRMSRSKTERWALEPEPFGGPSQP